MKIATRIVIALGAYIILSSFYAVFVTTRPYYCPERLRSSAMCAVKEPLSNFILAPALVITHFTPMKFFWTETRSKQPGYIYINAKYSEGLKIGNYIIIKTREYTQYL